MKSGLILKNRFVITATVYDKRGRVLSRGVNSYEKTHPKQAEAARAAGESRKIYLHAEISALISCRNGIPHKIMIERYDSDGNPKTAAPCPICQLAIKKAGIKYVEYTVG